MASQRSATSGKLFFLLFSLPFAGVGLGMLGSIWFSVWRSHQVQAHWPEVPAIIESVQLNSHRGSKGSITYSVTGTYHYEFKGTAHTSNRITFEIGSDSISTFHQRLHEELRNAKDSGRALTCRVDPATGEAVLRPAWRPEIVLFKALFATVFGGAGLGLFAAGIAGTRRARAERRLRERFPEEPWSWRPEWQSNILPARLGNGALASVIFLALFHGSTLPLWSVLPAAWAGGGAFPWLVTAVLLLGMVVSFFCGRSLLHWRKYRGTQLKLNLTPLLLGRTCSARLSFPREMPANLSIDFVLKCVRHVTTGSGKHARTVITELWRHQASASDPSGMSRSVEFTTELPANQPATRSDLHEDRIVWELTATADTPGVDLKVNFELPVSAAPRVA